MVPFGPVSASAGVLVVGRVAVWLSAGALATTCGAWSASAAPRSQTPRAGASKPPATTTASVQPPAAAPLADVRITGVQVFPQQPDTAHIRFGEVVVRKGRIACIGTTRPVDEPKVAVCPPSADLSVQDFAGKGWLIPALVDALGHVGVVEVNAEGGAQDGQTHRSTNAAQVQVRDALRLSMRSVQAARRAGVGFVVAQPQGTLVIQGQSVFVRTQNRADAVLQETAALHVHVGDSAKRDEPLMTSRSGVHAVLRDHFARAKRLQEGLRTAPRDPAERQWLASVRGDAALQVLVRALDGKLPVVVHAQRQEDIAAVLRLQQEFQLPMIVAEGAEAHLLADQLAAQKVPVLLGPVRLRPDDFATRHATVAAAGILHKAGVQVAIASSDSHNNRHLRWEAGYALDAGLPWQVALDAVTRIPAQLFGMQGPGQLRVGDLADLAVYDDDPLTLQGHIKLVLAGGELEVAPRQP